MSRTTGVLLLQAVRRLLIHIYRLAMGMLLRVWEFLLHVCSSAERPLHFIKLHLRVPEGVPQNTSHASTQASGRCPHMALVLGSMKPTISKLRT